MLGKNFLQDHQVSCQVGEAIMVQRFRTQGGRSGEAGDAVLKADKMESLPARPWRKILGNSQVSWVMESHPLIQPHHLDCNRGMDGNRQVHPNNGANNVATGDWCHCHVDPRHGPRLHGPRFH